MKLSEMKSVLAAGQIHLTKSLGQNFLHDQHQLERIVAAGQITQEDQALEIGPGLGPLTQLLLEKTANVLAIEKDRRLFEYLVRRFQAFPNLTLLCHDALDYLKQHRQWRGWKVVSNLPYSVASPILVEFARMAEGPDRIVATLQLEVVHRLMATPADPDYGLLTLLVQISYAPGTWFKIPASCFFPVPDVDSACVVLTRRPKPLLSEPETAAFEKIVKRSFSQRRKMMLKLLKQDWPAGRLEKAFATIGLSPQARAEQLELEQFVALTRWLALESE